MIGLIRGRGIRTRRAAAAWAVAIIAASLLTAPGMVHAATASADVGWEPCRYRWPKDGDDGGISGTVGVMRTGNPRVRAYAQFIAKGEKLKVFNNTGRHIKVSLRINGKYVVDRLGYYGDMNSPSVRDYPHREGLDVKVELDWGDTIYGISGLRT